MAQQQYYSKKQPSKMVSDNGKYLPKDAVTSSHNKKRKKSKRNKFFTKLGSFLKLFFKHLFKRLKEFKINKSDVKWFWDIKKWCPILIIMLIVSYAMGYNANHGDNQVIAEFTVPTEEFYMEETSPVEETIEETEPERDPEAVALAILADSSANGKTDEVKEIIMWVAINRTEDRANGYGESLIYEINRPKQWQNYNPEGMYLQTTYDLALKVLNTWKNNGPRPLYNDMLWAVYNADGSVTVRNKFSTKVKHNSQTIG